MNSITEKISEVFFVISEIYDFNFYSQGFMPRPPRPHVDDMTVFEHSLWKATRKSWRDKSSPIKSVMLVIEVPSVYAVTNIGDFVIEPEPVYFSLEVLYHLKEGASSYPVKSPKDIFSILDKEQKKNNLQVAHVEKIKASIHSTFDTIFNDFKEASSFLRENPS